jgi:hypothetical protein
MSADPTLLSLKAWQWRAIWRAIQRNEDWAISEADNLWQGLETICFFCSKGAGNPPANTTVFPEFGDPSKVIAAALCQDCLDKHPTSQQRLNVCLSLLRAMHQKSGKQLHYTFSPRRTHPR